MSMAPLERRFSRLLLLYPRAYRDQRGAEILATAMEAAGSDRRWPSPAEVADLAGHALRRRAGLCGEQAMGQLVAAGAPAGLLIAAVLSVVAFAFGEWAPWLPTHVAFRGDLGPFVTIGPVIYAGWLGAAAAGALRRPRLARAIAAVSLVVTVASIPASHLLAVGRPPLFLLATLACLGGFSIVAPLPQFGRSDARRWRQRFGLVVLGVMATAALVFGVRAVFYLDFDPRMAFYRLGLGTIAEWVPGLAAVCLALAVAARALGRPDLSARLALMVGPWLVFALTARPGPRLADRELCVLLGVAVVALAVSSARADHVTVRN